MRIVTARGAIGRCRHNFLRGLIFGRAEGGQVHQLTHMEVRKMARRVPKIRGNGPRYLLGDKARDVLAGRDA